MAVAIVESISMTKSMAKVNSFGLIIESTRAPGQMVVSTVLEFTPRQMEESDRASGLTVSAPNGSDRAMDSTTLELLILTRRPWTSLRQSNVHER